MNRWLVTLSREIIKLNFPSSFFLPEKRNLTVNRNTGETVLHKASRMGYDVSYIQVLFKMAVNTHGLNAYCYIVLQFFSKYLLHIGIEKLEHMLRIKMNWDGVL